jgi:hypothetical protein
LYPRAGADIPWILLVAERAECRRRLLLRLLELELNIDLATSSFEMAWLATLRRWAAVVIDASGSDLATRALVRTTRSLEPLAALPVILACDGPIAWDIRESCAATAGEGSPEELATIVWSVLNRHPTR